MDYFWDQGQVLNGYNNSFDTFLLLKFLFLQLKGCC